MKNKRDRLFFTQLFVPQASQSSWDRRAEPDVRLTIASAQSACGMEISMDNRVALIGIMVENPDSIETMNRILHEYGQYIIGRMGLPYRERGLSIISIVLDAPMNQISSLSGKLGMLDGISTKTIYQNLKKET